MAILNDNRSHALQMQEMEEGMTEPRRWKPTVHIDRRTTEQEPVAVPDSMTRLRCSKCGKSVSTPVSQDTVVRAWIECPECIGAVVAVPDLIDRAELLEDLRRREAALLELVGSHKPRSVARNRLAFKTAGLRLALGLIESQPAVEKVRP